MNRSAVLARLARLRPLGLVVALLAPGCADGPPPRDQVALPPKPTFTTGDLVGASVQRQAREQTYRVRTHRCKGLAIGSAFVAGPNLLVTNRHVVEGYTSIEVSSWDGRELAVTGVAVAEGSDLAILTVAETFDQPVVFTDPPPTGDEILVVGYPDGGAISLVPGTLVDTVAGELAGQDRPVLRLDAEVRQGNSGGPLYAGDRVVGVVFAYETTSGNGLALPASAIPEMVEADGFRPRSPASC